MRAGKEKSDCSQTSREPMLSVGRGPDAIGSNEMIQRKPERKKMTREAQGNLLGKERKR